METYHGSREAATLSLVNSGGNMHCAMRFILEPYGVTIEFVVPGLGHKIVEIAQGLVEENTLAINLHSLLVDQR